MNVCGNTLLRLVRFAGVSSTGVSSITGIILLGNLVLVAGCNPLAPGRDTSQLSPEFAPGVSLIHGVTPNHLQVVLGNNQSANVGSVLALPIEVAVVDVQGNPVTGVSVVFSIPTGAGSLSSKLVNTDENGIASVFWTLGSTSGTYAVTVSTVTPLPGSPSTLTLYATANSNTPDTSRSTVVGPPGTIAADGISAGLVTVTLVDSRGNPVPGKEVTLLSSRGAVDTISPSSAVSNANGVATFTIASAQAGTATVSATDTTDSITLTNTATATFTFGVASNLHSVVTISPSTLTADGSSTGTVTVALGDVLGNAASGKTVTLTSSRGASDSISPASVTTDSSGVATFIISSIVAGTATFTAHDTSDSVTLTQTVNETYNPGPVSQSVSTVSAFPTTVIANGTSSSTITVILTDANGNAVSGKSVSLASSRGGADTITTVSGTTNGSGVASFSVKSTSTGTAIISATDTTDSIAITPTAGVNFIPGTATKITFNTQPSTPTSAGVTFSAQPVVQLLDANNNVVTTAGVSLALTAYTDSSCTTTAGSTTSSVSATAGIATFTNATDTKAGTYYFGVAGLSGCSSAFTIAPAAVSATASTETASVSTVTAGVGTSTITVVLKDQYGNSVTGKTVTLTSSRGGADTIATSGQTFTVSSNSAGTSTYTAVDSTDGVTVSPAVTITYSTGAPAILAFSTQPSATDTAGVNFGTQPVVKVYDANNNLVSTATNTVALTVYTDSGCTTTSGTVLGASPVTAASGVASFAGVNYTKAGTFYVGASSTGLTAVCSNSFTVSPTVVSATVSTNTASLSTVTAGVGTSTITVTLEDQYGNAITGKTVTLSSSRGTADTISTSGQTFTVSSNTAGTSNYTAVDTTDSITLSTSAGVTYVAGAPSLLAFSTQPSSADTAGVNFSTQPVVKVYDANNNLVSTATNTVALTVYTDSGCTTTSGTALGVSPGTATSGVVTFANVNYTKAGTFYVGASASGLTAACSNAFTVSPTAVSATVSTNTASLSTVTAGVGTSTITVTLEDQYGNAITGKTVTLSSSRGTTDTISTSGQTFTVSSNTAGTSNYTAVDTTDSITLSTSAGVTYVAGAPSLLAFSTQPSSADTAGVNFGTQPVVKVYDTNNNLVSTATNTDALTVVGLTVNELEHPDVNPDAEAPM